MTHIWKLHKRFSVMCVRAFFLSVFFSVWFRLFSSSSSSSWLLVLLILYSVNTVFVIVFALLLFVPSKRVYITNTMRLKINIYLLSYVRRALLDFVVERFLFTKISAMIFVTRSYLANGNNANTGLLDISTRFKSYHSSVCENNELKYLFTDICN